uniref:Hedgehog/Intein (Hint) domain-containing protein n=1 Tax=viral metagenome TaxID=1070528 RepID=A0A6C0DRA8_9ZZZZ
MIVALIMTLALGYGLARIMVGQHMKEIQAKWAAYRCAPEVMATAGLFKPDTDPRSGFDFAFDNFSFCTSEIAKSVLTVALKPVMDVFYQMTNSAIQSISFTMNLRTLASNLFNGLNRIFDVFTRRFNLTIHELHKTFMLQLSAIAKANAIANASIYAGISVIRTIMNLFKLMMIVSVAILVILVVLVIFLFFVLAPTIPVILIAISALSATSMAGSVGGMGDAFCFDGDTRVRTGDGTKPIHAIAIGDLLEDGSRVTATMRFTTDSATAFYRVDGIHVSGSHLVYRDGVAVPVNSLPDAVEVAPPHYVYCLNTTSHRIGVTGDRGVWSFADWEELDNCDMGQWEQLVQRALNGAVGSASSVDILESESGLALDTVIELGDRSVAVDSIRPGDRIPDGAGFTQVMGTVLLDGTETRNMGSIDGVVCSGACWVEEGGRWIRAALSKRWVARLPVNRMVMLVTESGSFNAAGVRMRDFTDVGLREIEKTYAFTIGQLTRGI